MKRIYMLCLVIAFLFCGCGHSTPEAKEPEPIQENDRAEEQEVDETLENILNQLDELDQILDGDAKQEETANE